MGRYDWIKVGVSCNWNDVAINDYEECEREIVKETTYEVIEIKLDDGIICDDTIILISNGVSEVEVYAYEIERLVYTGNEDLSTIEQIDLMSFTKGQKDVLEFVFNNSDDFSDEDYFDLAFFFAKRNGLNNHLEFLYEDKL